jgi:hypothetical protein
MTKSRSFNKAACKRLAAALCSETGLHPMDALDPWKLAELYGIDVIPLSTRTIGSDLRDHVTVPPTKLKTMRRAGDRQIYCEYRQVD